MPRGCCWPCDAEAGCSSSGDSCACAACSMCCPRLPEIEESEDEDPHEVHEVPVKAQDLDDLVVAAAPGQEAVPLFLEVAAPHLHRDDRQEDHADRHVGAVETG